MDIQKIKELALANGFKLKEQASGNMDLNAYVYDFANAVEREIKAQSDQKIKLLLCDEHLKKCESPTGVFNSQYPDEEPCLICLAKEAKAQAVQEGFVLVEKAKIKTWFQDDDEPENFCSEESEIADLADPYETGEIIKINRIEDCVISVTPLYGTWKIDRIDQEGDVHRSFVLCDSYYEAEKVIVSNKEVDDEWLLAQQAQEPAND